MRGLEIFQRHLVILDTVSELKVFMREVERAGCDPLVTNIVLDELVSAMHQEQGAREAVIEYAQDVAIGKHLADDYSPDAPNGGYISYDVKPALAPAIEELGYTLLIRVNDMGLYNKEGLLAYGLYADPKEDRYEKVNKDIILVSQTHEDFIN